MTLMQNKEADEGNGTQIIATHSITLTANLVERISEAWRGGAWRRRQCWRRPATSPPTTLQARVTSNIST